MLLQRVVAAAARPFSARNASAAGPSPSWPSGGCRLFHSTRPSSLGALGDAWGFLRGLTLRAEASHILVKGTDEAAQRRISAIRNEIGGDPAKFAEVAARNSDCPSGQRGGSLGEFGRYSMVPEFDQVVFRDEVGVVHGPIETGFGYHLILIERRTGTTS